MIALLCAHNSVNCHAVICYPSCLSFGETPLVNCGSRSYFSTLLTTIFIAFHHHLFAGHISFSSYFTSTHLIFCVWQAGEIDNLSVLLEQNSLLVIMCRCTSIIEKRAINILLSLLQILLNSITLIL